MSQQPLPAGVTRTATGYRAFVWVPWPGYPNGRVRSKRFTRTPTYEPTLSEIVRWREDRRVEARRRRNENPIPGEEAVPALELPTEDWTRLTRSLDGWCYVYFVRAGDRIKIGRATDVGRRFLVIQALHAYELSLVLSIPAHAALEAAIHRRFKHLKERGEWFRLEPDLAAFILAVKQGANPVALLW